MSRRRRRRGKDRSFRAILLLVVYIVIFGGGLTTQNIEFLVVVVVIITVMLLALKAMKRSGSGHRRRGVIGRLKNSAFGKEWLGKRGESLIERRLKYLQLFGINGYTLRNVYLPTNNGGTSEIDLLFITQKGIFVFESKNFSGWIFGNEEDRNWTASLPNGQKNQFDNPIKQNKTHIKWLRFFVGEGIPLFSIVVFSNRCKLKSVTLCTAEAKVIKLGQTVAFIRDIWEEQPVCLWEQEVRELYEALSPLAKVDDSVKAAHIQNIEQRKL